MNTYDVGDTVRIQGMFVNSAGEGVNPASITAWHRIIKPTLFDAVTIAYGVGSMANPSPGCFYTDVLVNSGGEWRYRIRGYGGNGAAAAEGKFMALMPVVGE